MANGSERLQCLLFYCVPDCESFKSFSVILQLGSRLIELLTETAYIQPPLDQSADSPPDVRPAFRHRFKPIMKNPG